MSDSAGEPAATAGHDRRALPLVLLLLACGAAMAAGLDGITLPWNLDPMRGLVTSSCTAMWVTNHLTYGLGFTHGIPVLHVGEGHPPDVIFNWHHPAIYPLWLTGFAAVLGNEPWVLRLAHSLLVLPSVPALSALVARFTDRTTGAMTALLYATCPLITYAAFMVLHDGVTLSLGIITCCLFQRHLDRPERCRSWQPGLAFFACCLNDIPGYFAGFSLFALAVVHRDRARALRAVLAMFAISLAALAVTAVHYGVILGGPLGYLRGVLDIDHQEHVSRVSGVWRAHVESVLLQFGGGPLVLLAALGVLAAIPRASKSTRRLVWLGTAVALPWITNYVLFPFHAPVHFFWPLAAFGGLAVIAAVVPATGLSWLGAGRFLTRLLGGLLLSLALAALGYGTVRSHTLIGENSGRFAAGYAVVGRVIDRLDGCRIVLTTADTGIGQIFGREFVVGNICNVELLDLLLEIGRRARIDMDVGFILESCHAASPLAARLRSMAAAVAAEDCLLFRLHLHPQ
jgi:hypothetical protein